MVRKKRNRSIAFIFGFYNPEINQVVERKKRMRKEGKKREKN